MNETHKGQLSALAYVAKVRAAIEQGSPEHSAVVEISEAISGIDSATFQYPAEVVSNLKVQHPS